MIVSCSVERTFGASVFRRPCLWSGHIDAFAQFGRHDLWLLVLDAPVTNRQLPFKKLAGSPEFDTYLT